MSFIAYLIVLIFAAGSALFGLDLLTAPLPQQDRTHVAANPSPAPAPDKLQRRMADEQAMRQEGKPGALTPVYPSHPGTNDVKTVTPTNPATRAETQNAAGAKPAETTGAAPSESSGPASSENMNKVATVSPTPKVAPQAQAAMHAPVVEPQVQTATPAAGRCDVAACSAAYRSFRASDCTYQPYFGQRRACVAIAAGTQHSVERTATVPGAQRSAVRPRDRDSAPIDVHAVARQQVLPQQDDYDDNTAEDDEDIDTPDPSPDSVVIIRRPRW